MDSKTLYMLNTMLLVLMLTAIPVGAFFALFSGEWRYLLLSLPGAITFYIWLE